MFNLEELRKKSPAKKKMIALTVSASITGAIFIVWISSFWVGSPSGSLSESKKGSFSELATPLASIKNNFVDVYSGFIKLLNIRSEFSDKDSKSF